MNYEMFIVFGVLALTVFLFVTEKLSVDLVALLALALLLISGVITPAEGLSGFSNAATVTVAAMFILSAGLFKTGAVDRLGGLVNLLFKRNFYVALFAVMCLVGALSAFINNTPVIAIFLPVLLGAAREIRLAPSKILMPVSFASMFGGVCTLIGTSTNILVSSIAEKNGLPAFSMFEFAPLGLIFFVVGSAYMLFVGVPMIPERGSAAGELTEDFALSEYLTEIVLLPEAASVGHAIKDAPLIRDLDIAVLKIRRSGGAGATIFQPPAAEQLQAGDVLLVRCDLEKIRRLQKRAGISLKPQAKWGDSSLTDENYLLVEAVIAPNSALIGSTLQQSGFRESYAATVLAMRHRGRVLREKLSNETLSAGDLLLVELRRDTLGTFKRSGDFIITSERQTVEFRRSKVLLAGAVVAGVIMAASLNFAPIVAAAVVGAVLLVLTGCLSLEEAYQAIEWKIVFLLAGVLSLGIGLEKTGAAALISSQIVSSVGVFGLVALVSAFYLLTSVLTEAMSNNATAALLAPIAIATASSLGISPQPFLVAVTFAASASFITPVGYQTNTMIYEPGRYKFTDFVKVGTPLNIIFWLLATFLIPVFWSF